jgi:myo-inositol-1-phosphate synthase
MSKINVGIIGAGNCAAGFIRGIEHYRGIPQSKWEGLMHSEIGPYKVTDIEITSAFDADSKKAGKKLAAALAQPPNMVAWGGNPKSKVVVQGAPALDGIGAYVEGVVRQVRSRPLSEFRKNIISELESSKTEMLVNYLPVGSQKATEFWAEIALKTNIAFINAIPVFIASDKVWERKFAKAKLPIIGDDMKGILGATIVHRVLANIAKERGADPIVTYQLNVGGNTDFLNMLERSRLESKKISKTESVQSQLRSRLPDKSIHIGPSDYVPFLHNTKIAFMRLKGKMWAGVPYDLEVKLEVDDKANAGGIIADAVRMAKLALDRGQCGALKGPSAYLMKHPPVQMSDSVAKIEVEKFIAGA